MFSSRRSLSVPRTPLLVALALVVCLAIPAASLAQSAGDQQYADPLAGQNQPSSPSSGTGSQGKANPGSGSGSTPTAQTQTQAPAPSATQQTSDSQAAGAHLPRTGIDVVPIVLSGAGLLISGMLLLWRLGPARRRRREDPFVLFDGTLPPLR